jgi:hypothetical protein
MNISSRAIIKTRFLGPTNNRGARIKATCRCGSVTIPYAYEASGGDAHWLAVQALIKKFDLKWGNKFTVGSDNDGYYFIPADEWNVAILED